MINITQPLLWRFRHSCLLYKYLVLIVTYCQLSTVRDKYTLHQGSPLSCAHRPYFLRVYSSAFVKQSTLPV